ncbi:penicillin-insensitive murein endopeptidase [Desulfocicer vacuolatum]|uniref:penicillin-insensitive murein endopeptidase n=1 Tax=Desulfocicer vacuolatum TaxID=2298 RepID=UPI001E31A248|nr:penicillin-insensitive murein endopeptidase [Desulfocicer vacuolatum]
MSLGLFTNLWGADLAAEPVEIYGTYTAGCICNATVLPAQGRGYQVVRLKRQRYFGHPTLISLIEDLGQQVFANDWGILYIGDLSQKTGGPMPNGHASHQNGLDADIMLMGIGLKGDLFLNETQREKFKPQSVLNKTFTDLDLRKWHPRHGEVIRAAASFTRVERIFVHPLIKRALCRQFAGEKWLHKIRPWWGHYQHFHIRLACPGDSPHCVSQPEPPLKTGCGEDLNWWFSDEAQQTFRKKTKGSKTPQKPSLPPQCLKLLGI